MDHAVAGVSHADANPDRQAARHRRHLIQEPALAHPSPALDQDDGPDAGKEVIEVLASDRELDVTAADRLAELLCLRSKRGWSHYRPFGRRATIRTAQSANRRSSAPQLGFRPGLS
jgi:hypothetical protein